MTRSAGAAILAVALSMTAHGQADQAQPLAVGAAVERTLGPAESHAYSIFLATGQMARLELDHPELDFAIRIAAPDGKDVGLVDVWKNRVEHATIVADVSGSYRVTVTLAQRPTRGSSYKLAVTDLREATDADRSRSRAELAFTRGEEASDYMRGGAPAEGLRRSLPLYREARALFKAAGDRAGEAQAVHKVGMAHMNLSENREALAAHREAAAIRHELGDPRDEASSLHNAAVALFYLTEFKEALALHERALPLQQSVGNINGEAYTLSSMGLIHHQMGDAQASLAYYERAIDRWRRARNRRGEGLGLHNLGGALLSLGDNQRSLEVLRQAATIRRAAGDLAGEAQSLSILGSAYRRFGDLDRALEIFEAIVPVRSKLGDRRGEGYSLQGLAMVQLGLGRPREAAANSERSVSLLAAIGDRDGEGSGWNILGQALTAAGEPRKGLDAIARGLEIHRAIGNRRFEASGLIGSGEALQQLGDTARALESFERAVALARELRLVPHEGDARTKLARLLLARGDLAGARAAMEPAIEILESWRLGTTSPDYRTSMRAVRQDAYELFLDILMALHRRDPVGGHAAGALHFSERTRARGLVDLLAEIGVDIQTGVDPALRERERTLVGQIRQQAAQIDRLARDAKRAAEAEAAERALAALAAEHVELQRRLRMTSPQYAALAHPRAVTAADIQQILDDESLLLEYAVGEQRSYVWAIGRRTMAVYELAGRRELDAAARQVHEMTAGSHRVERRGHARDAAARMSDLLLRPVARQLRTRRLIIVPDAALQLVPFAALPAPGTASPLIERHELVVLPSVSALVALRSLPRAAAPSAKPIALFADPVFDATDPRVRRSAADPAAAAAETTDGTRDQPLDRLPFSRKEAAAIVGVAGRDAVDASLDFGATRAAASASGIGAYRILHFATHAVVDYERPALSGIVLSRVTADGTPQDGWLRMHDIYNLALSAELVVLSACRTAVGRDIRGEGLVGLTRGFMYAGAQSVLASLWEVRDEATAELMRRFYRALLRDRMPAAAALRAAQLSMWRDPAWRAPSYWAGFRLHGDWRPRSARERRPLSPTP